MDRRSGKILSPQIQLEGIEDGIGWRIHIERILNLDVNTPLLGAQ